MSTVRVAPWILAAILASSACHRPATEVEQQTSTTRQTTTTAKVEECSWCPAPEPSGTVASGQPAGEAADLMGQLASITAGTAFGGLTEEEVRSDISSICGAGEGGGSRQGAAGEAARRRAGQLGVPGSSEGIASYAELLETEADRRCP